MKRFVFLLMSVCTGIAADAESNLVLVIDQSAQTMDWLDGFSITRDPASPFDDNTFGGVMFLPFNNGSPLLNYSGAGSHTNVMFQRSEDFTRLTSIRLGSTAPPGPNATFSGTAEGPTTPSGGWSAFWANLERGEYTLPSSGVWNGGIHVVVTGQSTVEVLRPDPSDQLQPGSNFRIVWRTQGISGGTDWNFFFDTNNIQARQLFATAVDDGVGNWHADVTIPSDLHSTCNYTLRIHDDVSEAEGRSGVFCVGRTNLVLVINLFTQTMDWLDGFTITRPASPFLQFTGFGRWDLPGGRRALITSPLLNYTGEGSHTYVALTLSEDFTRVEGMWLGLNVSDPQGGSRSRASFSGTAEGPVAPTFGGDSFFSWFVNLNEGEYILGPGFRSDWNGSIRVVVTNVTPRLQVLRPNSSDQLHPGSNFRIVWRTEGISGGTDWNFFFDTNNVHARQVIAKAVNDGGGNWHADATIPNDLPSACNYTLRIHEDGSEADGRSEVFCLGVPIASVRVSEVEICWTSRSDRQYQVQFRSVLTTNLWTSLGAPVQGNGATNCVTDPVVTGRPQKLCRVEELP